MYSILSPHVMLFLNFQGCVEMCIHAVFYCVAGDSRERLPRSMDCSQRVNSQFLTLL